MRHPLVEDARHVASMASQRFVTEEYAVAYLAEQGTAAQLRQAAIEFQNDPDTAPLVAALLKRAAERVENPLPVRRHLPPDVGSMDGSRGRSI